MENSKIIREFAFNALINMLRKFRVITPEPIQWKAKLFVSREDYVKMSNYLRDNF